MTRPAVAHATAAAAAAAVLAVIATGCTASTAPPRTVPNQVERDAVQSAVGYRGVGTVDADIPWVQLWTIAQYPAELKNCAADASHGQLEVNAGPLLGNQIEYHIVGSGSQPNEVEAGRIIAACRAQTPVDDRMLRLPAGSARELYGYDLTVLRPCLISHGYEVDRPPSRERFERLIRAQTPWSPYDLVVTTSRSAWYALSDACPALPADIAAAVPEA